MNLDIIKKMIEQGESNTVEFKKTTGQLRNAFETVCAFLNGEGGTILIGVSDNGKIVGQEISDKTKKEIAKVVSELEPSAQSHLTVSYISIVACKYIITIEVSAGDHIPYIFDGRPYQRIQSTTSKMPQHRYEQLIIKRGQLNHSWEDLPAKNGYDIVSLDQNEIRKVLERGVTFNRIPAEAAHDRLEDALTRLNLLKNGQLNNAAVVLCAKEPIPEYSQCLIKLGRFNGIDKLGDFIDSQQISGNAFKLLSEADNFLRRHLPIASFFPENFERIDKPALPVLAVREALINAICHRDYSNPAGYIMLAIYNDRLEIWSYGKLLPEIEIKDLKNKHHSCLRNPKISQIFYNRGLIEKWATGINKMFSYCHDAGVPEPEFEEYSGGFAVTFRFAEPIGARSAAIKGFRVHLTARQAEIFKILKKHGSASIKQIMSELKNPPSRTMVKRDLDNLKKQKVVEINGSARSAIWVLR